jgi:hypothetical protein
VNPTLIPEAGVLPVAIAVDANHIYWTNTSSESINRANLDGTGVNPNFLSYAQGQGVAVDGTNIYWSTPGEWIGRANLDGSGVNSSFINVGDVPSYVAIGGGFIYWTYFSNRWIGRANLDGTDVNQTFLATGGNTTGLAADGSHIYWTNISGFIGRANLDASGKAYFQTGAPDVRGLAVDGSYLYFGQVQGVGRSNLDGTDVNPDFIPLGLNNGFVVGIAVIPEPTTGVLVLGGVLGLAIKRRVRA